tara:strand:- start:51 stop:329 length:279 start_codon:yes stop_codon:yes gene_type:complete
MNKLPKDSEKEIWLHHNSAGDSLYDFGFGLVNTSDEKEIKANKGKLCLDTYKAAMLGCEFEGEYVKNVITGEELEPCKDGDKYQVKAYSSMA